VKNNQQPQMLRVFGLRKVPTLKWTSISGPITRSEAVMLVRDEWKAGRIARIKPVSSAKAA
jgi:hypothetical protein